MPPMAAIRRNEIRMRAGKTKKAFGSSRISTINLRVLRMRVVRVSAWRKRPKADFERSRASKTTGKATYNVTANTAASSTWPAMSPLAILTIARKMKKA